MTTRVNIAVLAALCLAGVIVSAVARPRQQVKSEDVVILGRVVDLQGYMTGQESQDPVKDTRDNLRAGVPAGLEIEDGIVVIGMGKQNPARRLLPLAYKEVELTGKLYEKDGLLYVDMQEIKPLEVEGAPEGEQPAEPGQQPPDGDQD
jgi:hypothetical protein